MLTILFINDIYYFRAINMYGSIYIYFVLMKYTFKFQ